MILDYYWIGFYFSSCFLFTILRRSTPMRFLWVTVMNHGDWDAESWRRRKKLKPPVMGRTTNGFLAIFPSDHDGSLVKSVKSQVLDGSNSSNRSDLIMPSIEDLLWMFCRRRWSKWLSVARRPQRRPDCCRTEVVIFIDFKWFWKSKLNKPWNIWNWWSILVAFQFFDRPRSVWGLGQELCLRKTSKSDEGLQLYL